MRKRAPSFQSNIINLRATLRDRLVRLAKTHRACPRARGCGCVIDRALTILEDCERSLFNLELEGYADPSGERKIALFQQAEPTK